MAMRYICPVCGKSEQLAHYEMCCGVRMKRDKGASTWNGEKVCPICGKSFVVASNRQKYCGDEACLAEGKRRRDRLNDPRRNKEHNTMRPYSWLEQDVTQYRAPKRKIVDVLTHEYPWHDVLSGNMPSMPQWT